MRRTENAGQDRHSRTRLLLGEEPLDKLRGSRVIVFGLGGVGGYAAEALARTGVGAMDLVDGDVFEPSNLNRQLFATVETIGQPKAQCAQKRIAQVSPECVTRAFEVFYGPENSGLFDFSAYDCVIDAVDMVSAKVEIAVRAAESKTPAVSCMGAAGKLDASALEVCDIYQTSVCPLARVMRRELRRRSVPGLRVVCSREEPKARSVPPGSVPFVPGAAGMMLAGEAVRLILSASGSV